MNGTSPTGVASRRLLPLAFIVLLAAGAGTAGRAAAQSAVDVASAARTNQILLRVNDRIATTWDYEQRLSAAREGIRQAPSLDRAEKEERLSEVPRQVMRSMWDELLLLSRADQLGITIPEAEVQEALRAQMEQFGIEEESEMVMALAQNGLTMAQYLQSLENQLLIRDVMSRELYPRIQVEEDELRAVYRERRDNFRVPEKRRVREVVVLEEGTADAAEARQLAGRIQRRWSAGEEPEPLAEELGTDVALFVDLGLVESEDLASDLAAAAWSLEAGEVSEPLRARGGWHVLQVTAVEPESVRPFEEVRELVARAERGRRLQREEDDYLRELEERSYFEANPPPELRDFRTASGRTLLEGGLQMLGGLEESAPPGSPSEGTGGAEEG